MMVATYLLVLAVLISAAASRLLPGAKWVFRAPGLGLAAWHAVLAGVVASGVAAAISPLVGWPMARKTVCVWWAMCLDALTGGLGWAGRVFGWVAVGVVLLMAARAARALARAARDIVHMRQQHRDALALIGRHDAELRAIVVADDRPAAYSLPGRDGVVITSGALAVLPARQVAAILAHERAHARGRHHLLLASARLLSGAFPAVAVFAEAHRQIDRLVELHADDVAAREHCRIELARALVACAEAAARPSSMAIPVMAVAAHGGDALERVNRLLRPPATMPRRQRLSITVGLTALVFAPIAVGVLGAVFPAFGSCLPMGMPYI
jgi:Zn-dependent protease with chaperone function